jgi:hypothetical protein
MPAILKAISRVINAGRVPEARRFRQASRTPVRQKCNGHYDSAVRRRDGIMLEEAMDDGHNADHEARMVRAEHLIALEMQSELRTLAKSQVLMADGLTRLPEMLTRFMANTEQRFAETTDKLHSVIDLMDRHVREHGRQ